MNINDLQKDSLAEQLQRKIWGAYSTISIERGERSNKEEMRKELAKSPLIPFLDNVKAISILVDHEYVLVTSFVDKVLSDLDMLYQFNKNFTQLIWEVIDEWHASIIKDDYYTRLADDYYDQSLPY